MKGELNGAIVAMIFGLTWVSFGFLSALLVGVLGIVGFLITKYSKTIVNQLATGLLSAMNVESNDR